MSNRFERANSQLQKQIALILQNKMNDPRLSPFIYVSEVSVTPDFQYCKMKIALDNDDENELKKTIQILQKSEGFIKRELAKVARMPHIPKLQFEIDKGTSASIRINEILQKLNIPKGEDDEGN